jgi:hypothetical protein
MFFPYLFPCLARPAEARASKLLDDENLSKLLAKRQANGVPQRRSLGHGTISGIFPAAAAQSLRRVRNR